MLPAASRRMSQIRNRLLRDALGPDNYQSLTLPTFLYQHILAPHPPFSIGADGNFRETPMDTLSDGSHAIMDSPDLRAEYIRGYSEKAECFLVSKEL